MTRASAVRPSSRRWTSITGSVSVANSRRESSKSHRSGETCWASGRGCTAISNIPRSHLADAGSCAIRRKRQAFAAQWQMNSMPPMVAGVPLPRQQSELCRGSDRTTPRRPCPTTPRSRTPASRLQGHKVTQDLDNGWAILAGRCSSKNVPTLGRSIHNCPYWPRGTLAGRAR